MEFLDKVGVTTLWNKIKEMFVSKQGGGEIIASSSKPFTLNVDLSEDYGGESVVATVLKIGGTAYDDSIYLGQGSSAVRIDGELYINNHIYLRGNPDIEWNDTTIEGYHLNIDKLIQDGYLTK